MTFIASMAIILLASAAIAQLSPAPKTAVDQLIPWLLDEDQQLRGVPFSEVILDTTGKKVVRFDSNNPVDQRIAKAIAAACNKTMKRLNAPGSAIQNVDRINEVSSHFEESLRELLNATPALSCDFPLTTEGKVAVRLSRLAYSRSGEHPSFTSIQNFTLPEAATAVSARSILNRRKRPTRCARTPCILSCASSMNRGMDQTRQMRRGSSRDGI